MRTSLRNASPSGFIAAPVFGQKWPTTAPTAVAISTWPYSDRKKRLRLVTCRLGGNRADVAGRRNARNVVFHRREGCANHGHRGRDGHEIRRRAARLERP